MAARDLRERASSEGRLRARVYKLTARSAGSRVAAPVPRTVPHPAAARASTFQAPSGTTYPTRRVILVPTSHLDSGEGPGPRSQSQPVEKADSNLELGQGYRASLGGPELRLPTQRIPVTGLACGPGGGGAGHWGIWEPVKELSLLFYSGLK